MTRARIVGIGAYAPKRILTNAELEKMVETSDEWIVQRTGIRERRIVGSHESTATLASHAATRSMIFWLTPLLTSCLPTRMAFLIARASLLPWQIMQ